jgi:predicted Zn-dependent protease
MKRKPADLENDDVLLEAYPRWLRASTQWQPLADHEEKMQSFSNFDADEEERSRTAQPISWDGGQAVHAVRAAIGRDAKPGESYVGLTSRPIFFNKWRFAFSVHGGGYAIVSYDVCRWQTWVRAALLPHASAFRKGDPKITDAKDFSWDALVTRATKAVLCGIGRNLGVKTCTNACPNARAVSLNDLDRVSIDYCADCRRAMKLAP